MGPVVLGGLIVIGLIDVMFDILRRKVFNVNEYDFPFVNKNNQNGNEFVDIGDKTIIVNQNNSITQCHSGVMVID